MADVQALNFDDIKNSATNMTNLAQNLSDTSDNLNSAVGSIQAEAWGGDASNEFRKELGKLAENLPDAKQQLALSVLFLTSCANGYEALGNENVEKLKNLVGGQKYIDNYNVSTAPTPDLDARYGIDAQNAAADPNAANQNTDNGYLNVNGNNYNGNSGRSSSSSSSSSSTAADNSADNTTTNTTDNTTTDLLTSLGLVETSYASLLVTKETTGTINETKKNDYTDKTFTLPSTVQQGNYGIAGYDYNLNTGEAIAYADGTKEKEVYDKWKEQGSAYKKGIAIINVNGEDRYLVNVSSKYGEVGDCIDFVLEDGTKVKCVIAGHTDTSDWGLSTNDGKTNIINFRVQKAAYDTCKCAPTTESWGLEWDSKKTIATVDNTGTIIGTTVVPKGTLTGANTTTDNGNVVDGTGDGTGTEAPANTTEAPATGGTEAPANTTEAPASEGTEAPATTTEAPAEETPAEEPTAEPSEEEANDELPADAVAI